jgi:acetyl esterase/lipase
MVQLLTIVTRMRNRIHVLGYAFAVWGCSSSAAAPAPTASASPAPTANPAPADTLAPTVRFLGSDGRSVESVYYEDPFALRIEHLVAGERVQIAARMEDWGSRAEFVADSGGVVDTSRDASQGGSYLGVDGDGLVWSLDRPALALAKSADLDFQVTRADGAVIAARLRRSAQVTGVRAERVTGQSFVGTFVTPSGPGPYPAILAFGGSEGGVDGGLDYASVLVRHGYAVLALAYFNEGALPKTLTRIPLEYFDAALDWLATRPEVRRDRLGAIGGSRGGELALLLAARRADLTAVVADSPSNVVWGSTGDASAPAWTAGGMPLPSIKSRGKDPGVVKNARGETAYALTPVFEDSLSGAMPEERAAARIPVERAHASIAMYGGDDDQLWPSCRFMRMAVEDLTRAGHDKTHEDEATCFASAGHWLTILGLPTTWATSYQRSGLELALGGTPQGIARASRSRHERLVAFLERTLKRP